MKTSFLSALVSLVVVLLAPVPASARPPGLATPSYLLIDDFTPIPDHFVVINFRCDAFEQRQNQVWATGALEVYLQTTEGGETVNREWALPRSLPATEIRYTQFQPYGYPGTIPVVRMMLGGGRFTVDGHAVEFGPQDIIWFGPAEVFAAVDVAVRTKPAAHVGRALNDLEYGVGVDQYLWP